MSRWRVEASYLGRYLGSGVLNTAGGFAIIFALAWAGVSPYLANIAGYAFGLALGFFVSRTFVFRSNGHFVADGVRYLAAFLLAFVANIVMLRLALNSMKLPVIASQLVATGSYTALMYLLTRWFVFTPTRHQRDE